MRTINYLSDRRPKWSDYDIMARQACCLVCGKERDDEEEVVSRKIEKDSNLYQEILKEV